MKEKTIAILSLFASTSTLLCCALPALLVMLGFGAVVAGAVSSVPFLVPLSQNKEWVFLFAGILIGLNWVFIKRIERQVLCEDTACETASRFSTVVLWISTGLFLIGFFVAFLAFPMGKALGIL